MNTEAATLAYTDERKDHRLPHQGEFEYTCDSKIGSAHWSSLSHRGASITMGRYLSPGRLIRVCQDNHELIGYVVWCKPAQSTNSFAAGIRFIESGIETSFMVLSTMVQTMLDTHNTQKINQQPLAVQ